MYILYVAYLIFLSYIASTVLFMLVLAVAGRIGQADDSSVQLVPRHLRKIGVLIPAYKEDAVIVESVLANLTQDYPADRFDLIVIADSLQGSVLTRLAVLPVRVIEVSFVTSTVSKAINAALARLSDTEYDIIVVSDADNHMAPDFLSRINVAFEQGWRAVQGHRVAKNTDTGVATLDAISEEINNHMFRKGSRVLGSSASIIGSGMAIETALMKKAMANLLTIGGYDKELEMNIVLNGHTVGYLDKAFIHDEKVANRAVFENQRTRWIAAQWQFLTGYFRRGMGELLSGRLTGALKIVQALVLPKVLLIGLLAVCTSLGLLSSNPVLWVAPFVLLVLLSVSLILSVPAYLWRRVTMRELVLIPVLMLSFAKAVFNMRKAFKRFMHTPHTSGATSAATPERSEHEAPVSLTPAE